MFEGLSSALNNPLNPLSYLGISLDIPKSNCTEFLLQNDGESLFGEGRYTIIKDPAMGCKENKKVSEKLTYLNVDTGQYMYWIDYGIQQANGSWVV